MMGASTAEDGRPSPAVAMTPATTLTRRPTDPDIGSKVRRLFRTRPYPRPTALLVIHPPIGDAIIVGLALMNRRLPGRNRM
jgi:hypothetical protein